jgi:uncharacterized protein (DUF2147 family)
MMRTKTVVTVILRIALGVGLALANARPGNAVSSIDPSGTWLTEDGRARIRVERCGPKLEQICGYIVWMKEPLDARGHVILDLQNPDSAKRSRPVLGHQLIMGLAPNPDDGRFHGHIYNAENGKFYDIAIWREAADVLKVKGCMLSILCSTQTWTPTTDALPGQLVGLTGDVSGPVADQEWARVIPARPPKKAAAK